MADNDLKSSEVQLDQALQALGKADLGRALITMKLMGVLFLAGFAALATGVMGWQDHAWYARAATADAQVVSAYQESRTSSTTNAQGQRSQSTSQQRVLRVRYTTADGAELLRSVDAGSEIYGEGETVRVSYQPDNAGDVRIYRQGMGPLLKVSMAASAVFALLLGILFMRRARKTL